MRKYRHIIALAVLATLGASAVFVMTRPPSARASLLARSKHFPLLHSDFFWMGYQWHPDGHIVWERPRKGGNREICRADPDSGAVEILARYTVNLSGYGLDDAGLISPDGKWLISTMQMRSILRALDGSAHITVPNMTVRLPAGRSPYFFRTVAWRPNSKEWVEFADENGQNILLIRAPASTTARKIPVCAVAGEQSLLGIDHQNNAIIVVSGKKVQILSVPLDEPAAPIKSWNVTPPKDALPFQPALSPDGKRIVWQGGWHDGSIKSEVANLFRSVTAHNTLQTRGLWVSNADGTGWKLIGLEDFSEKDLDKLKMIRITPDSKHVSFVFGNEFYTTPMPQ